MRLYRMELYKLCNKKLFITGVFAAVVLMFVYFWFVEVGNEISVVDGQFYTGYEAVQINKKITEEFAGILTNEKIDQIIDKYGLPSKLADNMPEWRDGNYLNDFVTKYFTNGAWETRTLPTETYALEETEFGRACEKMGVTPYLTYTKGCRTLVEMMQLGLILGSILIICGISVVFAQEDQTKMLPLLFTAEEGKKKDIPAKILASFTVAVLIFFGLMLINFVLCGAVYGLNGFENLTGMMLSERWFDSAYIIPFSRYLTISSGLGLLALLSLCAITLCVSSHLSTSFSAVIISAVCWGFPVLLRVFFGGFMWIIADSMPVFLIMKYMLYDDYPIWNIILVINLCISAGCLLNGVRYYMRKQAA